MVPKVLLSTRPPWTPSQVLLVKVPLLLAALLASKVLLSTMLASKMLLSTVPPIA